MRMTTLVVRRAARRPRWAQTASSRDASSLGTCTGGKHGTALSRVCSRYNHTVRAHSVLRRRVMSRRLVRLLAGAEQARCPAPVSLSLLSC